MNIAVKVINSFSIDGAGGNPAGVVLNAGALTAQQKQRVAYEAQLSEVAFLSPSQVADYKVDFFTPTKQIPHCGHATIAAFSYLKSLRMISGDVSSKETIDGTRQILFEGDAAYMQQSPAKFSHVNTEAEILASLGIGAGILDQSVPTVIGNTGNPFLLVPVRNELDLKVLKPDFDRIREISEALNCTGYYVFSRTAGAFDAQARMFAPAYGINEESATGMGAGPLAGYLYQYAPNKKQTYIIGQGFYMDPPSGSRIKVQIDAHNGSIVAGGNAYVVKTIQVEI